MVTIPDPELQVSFATALSSIRSLYLQEALSATIKKLEIPAIDAELAALVPPHSLATLAGHGLRGELMFPMPIVLSANPRLLGYYRLLYGYSQKEFYTSATGVGRFQAMEGRGVIREQIAGDLQELCEGMCKAGALLLAAIATTGITARLLDELTLLTLGPQLRGGANVQKGTAGIRSVFGAIYEIVQHSVVAMTDTRIEIKNAAGRTVLIQFAADPDIIIREEMREGQYRHLIAIEVKAGSDFSNIHNRIGEAEKSHQKARAGGFVECWTVVNVDKIDIATAHKESPSTNRFYRISDMLTASGEEYNDFRDRVVSLTGIV